MNGERIGLVGYSCNSGLGELNRQVAKYIPQITKWLIKPNKGLGVAPIPDNIKRVDRFNSNFFKDIDTVLFFETQFYPNLAKQAKEAGKRVVCVPMLEWTPNWKKPNSDWVRFVDLFICPTQHCYETLQNEGYPVLGFSWPHDTERFKFVPSEYCHQFLFIEGNGGFQGRKGGSVVRRAKELWPDMPLIVKTYRRSLWPKNTKMVDAGRDNLSLYGAGDVLLYPGKCDGIGLQPFEARVSGLPVIITEGRPWDEHPSMAKINSSQSKMIVAKGRAMDWYEADPRHLVEVCKSFLGKQVSEFALIGRAWAEGNSWNNKGASLTQAIVSGEREEQLSLT